MSERLKLNKEDGLKIAKSFGLAMVGATLAWLASLLPQVDFGPAYTPFVVALGPFLINFARKFLQNQG